MPKIVTFGEVMMRLSTPSYQKIEQATSFEATFAGSEMNVGAALANLGFVTEHVTVYPNNAIGRNALNFQAKLGFDNKHVLLEGKRMGIFYHEKGVALRSGKNVYDRENSAFAEQKTNCFNWEEILAGADWFHWSGITPALSAAAAASCLDAVKTAQKLGIPVSSDIYFRSNLWNYGKKPEDVLPELASYSNVVLASTENIEELFGIASKDFATSAAALMKKHPNIKKVIATNRTQLSASHNRLNAQLWNGTNFLKTEDIDINPIVDRVGGGDAFLGGFIYGQLTFNDDLKSLAFGVAASALKHTIEGDQNLVSIDDVLGVMEGERSGRLRR